VLQLPISGPGDGPVWAFTEAPRMVLSTIDWKPRVTGYSGFFPPQYPAQVASFAAFPSADSLDLLDGLGVKYVVLRTTAYRSGNAAIDASVSRAGTDAMTVDAAETLVAAIPSARLGRVDRVAGALVVTLQGT
jgi:hypothetical protein